STLFFVFSFYSSVSHQYLHSFPTRRSSDLGHYIGNSGYMEDEQAVLALAALAQPTRLQAFRLLVQNEPQGLPAGELARLLEVPRSEEHTSELQSLAYLVCRLLLEKKKKKTH